MSPVPAGVVEEFRHNLRVLEREIVRQLQSETACCGVTLAQCHVLVELLRAGTLSLSELADLMQLDRSTLSRTVDGLVRGDLVSRVANPDDRRAVRLTCTPEGSRRVAAIDQACNRKYAALLGRLPASRRQQVVETVRFLAGGLPRLRDAGTGEPAGCCAPDGPVAGAPAVPRPGGPRDHRQVSRRSR